MITTLPPPPDRLVSMAAHPWGRRLLSGLGLPQPVALRRVAGGTRPDALSGLHGVVTALAGGAAAGSGHSKDLVDAIASMGGQVMPGPVWSAQARVDFAVVDARGVAQVTDLARLRSFLQPLLRQLSRQAKVLLIADALPSADARSVVRCGLEGFVRSLAKEIGRNGSTANLLAVEEPSADGLRHALRFFLSGRSTYVSGQSLELRGGAVGDRRLGQVLVTGAARGLGRATAQRLHEEGFGLLLVDVPAAQDALQSLATALGARALALDITSPQAGDAILAALGTEKLSGVVHNAGITRDRLLRNMKGSEWDAVLAVNLQAIQAIDARLDAANAWAPSAREVLLSSINGIAGAAGQTNYSFTKAAVRGYAQFRSHQRPDLIVNAIAPGFIETEMTAKIPLLMREVGRRMNSLSQAGQPRDVAEAACFFLSPEAAGLRGQTLRVCGQAIVGA